MPDYTLSPRARANLRSITAYYRREAGIQVARQMLAEFQRIFRFLATTPGAGHKREDLTLDMPLLFWPHRHYLIAYRTVVPLEIIAVLHSSRDVPNIISDSR